MDTTSKAYAKKHGISASTARRRLEALVREGKASYQIAWRYPAPSNTNDRIPPPCKTVIYTIHA